MKANRTLRMKEDEHAQVGIGTMIVFIATILVAAAAAALLLDTSGKLQERSAQTGSEATQEVASNLIVKAIYGERDATSANLQNMTLTVSLAPGASPVDLGQMIVTYSDGSSINRLSYDNQTAGATTFTADAARDPRGTFSADMPVMTAGALVDIKIEIADVAGSELGPRTDVSVQLIPEAGTPISLSFTTPASYGTNLIVPLR
jgi:archaeal flagellin FlaB